MVNMGQCESLPEVERKRLLEGLGCVEEPSQSFHVLSMYRAFDMPTNWHEYVIDYGYASPSCVLWGAIDWDNNIWVYRELYVKHLTGDSAVKILEVDSESTCYTVLDSSCWNKTGFGP